MQKNLLFTALLAAGLVVGCDSDDDAAAGETTSGSGAENADEGDGGAAEEDSGGADEDGADSSTPDSDSGGADGGADEAGGSEESGGAGFISQPDGGGVNIECSVWSQDCPDGQKCMPWDNMGSGSWNATKCTMLDANPGQPGDECMVEGGGVSGIDTCDVSTMCWDTNEEDIGTCVAFCTGDETNPSCDDPDATCSIANDGTLILCLPTCDPLLQACPEGQACYPIVESFACAPDASGETGAFGDPCEFLNVCDPGLWCAAADNVPNCAGSQGCCSEFCDLSDAAATCSGAAGGQECVSYYEEGQGPPGTEDWGVCAIPA